MTVKYSKRTPHAVTGLGATVGAADLDPLVMTHQLGLTCPDCGKMLNIVRPLDGRAAYFMHRVGEGHD